jgi:hypothetical protein
MPLHLLMKNAAPSLHTVYGWCMYARAIPKAYVCIRMVCYIHQKSSTTFLLVARQKGVPCTPCMCRCWFQTHCQIETPCNIYVVPRLITLKVTMHAPISDFMNFVHETFSYVTIRKYSIGTLLWLVPWLLQSTISWGTAPLLVNEFDTAATDTVL